MFSIKLFTQSNNKEEVYEMLADDVGYNLTKAAEVIVRKKDPKQLIISIKATEPAPNTMYEALPRGSSLRQLNLMNLPKQHDTFGPPGLKIYPRMKSRDASSSSSHSFGSSESDVVE